MNIIRKSGYEAKKRFYREGIECNKVHWTVAAAATPGWAKRVFPDSSEAESYKLLWDDLFSLCRIGNGDHLSRWQEHDSFLRDTATKLNKLSFKSLYFTGPGTDLTVGLSSVARFHGGTSQSSRNVRFEPNIPTEECFTTPDWRLCSGTVRATRPFYINGVVISDLQLEISEGVIVDFSSSTGEETFKAYIASDEGASRLGEVALVDCSSPIFKTNRIYEEILLDENAACHIAIGSGYRFCLDLPENTPDSEWNDVGCNQSSVHTDIMISDENTNVHGTTSDGKVVKIISNGYWTDSIRNQST